MNAMANEDKSAFTQSLLTELAEKNLKITELGK
jgi:hypothetical protein